MREKKRWEGGLSSQSIRAEKKGEERREMQGGDTVSEEKTNVSHRGESGGSDSTGKKSRDARERYRILAGFWEIKYLGKE